MDQTSASAPGTGSRNVLSARGWPRRHLELLDVDECRRLLVGETVGRVGLSVHALPAVLPVNYLVIDDDVVFRTEAGAKLAAAVLGQIVAFEVDQFDRHTATGWSVMVVGQAREVTDPDQLESIVAAGLRPWAEGDRTHVVAVSIGRISGRRLVEVDADAEPRHARV